MEDYIQEAERLRVEALAALTAVEDEKALEEFYVKYLAKKGSIPGLMTHMKDVADKAAFGSAVNKSRAEVTEAYEAKKVTLAQASLNKRLQDERLDITLPGAPTPVGRVNPYQLVVDEVTDIFLEMGYEVCEGRDVETDKFNFELLNVPKGHPARDMQDTFYFGDDYLLRTQTSAAQAHRMSEATEKTPIRMIAPGKAYRRDDDDMTHSHQFGQIEGLVVDKDISIAHLKATLELFARKMFGEKREVRLRSSYFPFTEPSVEVDVSCFSCGGKGCSMCKGTGWIEILGAGMVNPRVLEACGYDPEVYSGFAFGVGVERVAMLRYGIDDIRRIYQNDFRFLKDFPKK